MAIAERVERHYPLPPSPTAPLFLAEINEARIQVLRTQLEISSDREAVEARCESRIELSRRLQELDPENLTWYCAEEFFTAFPQGSEAVWDLFGRWGVFKEKGKLTPPQGMEDVQPREFMDLEGKTLERILQGKNLTPEMEVRVRELAEGAVEDSWRQYHVVKTALLRATPSNLLEIVVGGRISQIVGSLIEKSDGGRRHLLAHDFINGTLEMAEKNGLPIVLLGVSADEIDALEAQHPGDDLIIMGIAKGYSSVLRQKVETGEVTELEIASGQTIDPRELKPGNYLISADANEGLPFVDNSACVAMMYALHHNLRKEQLDLIKDMVRVAAKLGPGKAAVHIVEPYSSPNLLRMVLEVNKRYSETAAFDAMVGTTICGGQTPKKMIKLAEEAEAGVRWQKKLYPSLPPIPAIQKRKICYQQVALCGC